MADLGDGAALLGSLQIASGIPDVRFQPDLSEVLRKVPADSPVLMLISGPEGCGQSSAARWLAFLRSGAEAPLVRLLPGELRSGPAPAALDRLREAWDAARGGALLVSGLADILSAEHASVLLEALLRWPVGVSDAPSVVLAADRESAVELEGVSPRMYASSTRAVVHALKPGEMVALLRSSLKPYGIDVELHSKVSLEDLFARSRQPGDLVNSRMVHVVAQTMRKHVAAGSPPEEAASSALSAFISSETSSALEDLDLLVGLTGVKESVSRLASNASLSQRRRRLGLDTEGMGHHMVFAGPAGTAKTTVARIVARILRDVGVLRSGHMVEVQRADIIGFSSAETSRRMVERVRRASGGVLFIDEAYTLTSSSARGQGEDQGREAVDTLLKMMEDYRDDFVVIVAGYQAEMDKFLNENPGLRSRFSHNILFPPYAPEEMLQMLDAMAAQRGYRVAQGVADVLAPHLAIAQHYPGFGNGRYIRTTLESAIIRQGERLDVSSSDDDLMTLLPVDFSSIASAGHRFGLA